MKTTKEMPIVQIQTGSVFLQDKIIDEEHCYVCGKGFNKFDDKHMVLLRVAPHKLGFCCPDHKGVVAEFIRQFKTVPGGWEIDIKKNINRIVVDHNNNNNSRSTGSKTKISSGDNQPGNGLDGTPKKHIRNKHRRKHI